MNQGPTDAISLLAGDIGGTKTKLGVFTPAGGPRSPLAEATFASADYPTLESLLHEFLHHTGMSVGRACFAVAGPVVGGRAAITNLPWTIEDAQLSEQLGVSSAALLNDLVAMAYAVPSIERSDLHTLNRGERMAHGTIAVVAPGTGLGEAYLTHDGRHYRAQASEGGHADFAPNDDLEAGLLAYLRDKYGHVSYERVCSGIGLSNIYAYLKDSGYAPEPPSLARKLADAPDPTPMIVKTALSGEENCELCELTLETFVAILAAEAGNMALKVMATGGVYLGGGIPPRILSVLNGSRFLDAFRNKGRMSGLLGRISVHVILDTNAPLHGAACYGLGRF